MTSLNISLLLFFSSLFSLTPNKDMIVESRRSAQYQTISFFILCISILFSLKIHSENCPVKSKFIPLFSSEVPMPEFGFTNDRLSIITRAQFYCYIFYIYIFVCLFVLVFFDSWPTNCFKRNTIIGVIISKQQLLTLCEWCTNEVGECKLCKRQFETLNGPCCCDLSKVKLRERLITFRKQ